MSAPIESGMRHLGARLERDLAAATPRGGRGPRAGARAPRRRAGCRRCARGSGPAGRSAGTWRRGGRGRARRSPRRRAGRARACVAAATKPAPGPASSSTSGRAVASTSRGTARLALREVVHEGQHRLVGPVQVLDDEHRRARSGEALEERPPGGEVLLARGLLGLEAEQRAQAGAQAVAVSPSRAAPPRGAPRARHAVALEDAGGGAHDLRERPEGDVRAERQAAALAPGDELGPVVEAAGELGEQAALADAGLADDEGEARAVLGAASSSSSAERRRAPPRARRSSVVKLRSSEPVRARGAVGDPGAAAAGSCP